MREKAYIAFSSSLPSKFGPEIERKTCSAKSFGSFPSFICSKRCSTQMYHALKAQHLTFSMHYQPYPHHTPNALDLLPK